MSDSRHHSLIRLMPSYRLEPKQIFNKDKCEKLLKSIMDPALEEFEYTSAEAESLAPHLSDTILSQVKRLNFDRYKFVCIVTIGQKMMQGFCEMYRCLSDKKLDKVAVYVYETQNLFAIATLYGFYCD